MTQQHSQHLIAGVNDKIPVGKSLILGLQHVLSMDLYIMPLILGGAIGLKGGDLSFLLQMSFFACGIATLLQSGLFMKYPIVQGPSYVPLAALRAIGATMGIPTMIGSLLPRGDRHHAARRDESVLEIHPQGDPTVHRRYHHPHRRTDPCADRGDRSVQHKRELHGECGQRMRNVRCAARVHDRPVPHAQQ